MDDRNTPHLTEEERRGLLRLAREAIVGAIAPEAASGGETRGPVAAQTASGIFVTLRRRGALRGCIGIIRERLPLEETVARCAVSAATEDQRFSPVTPGEVDGCDIEISVLTAPQPAGGPEEIEIGTHGVIVSLHGLRGVLLPGVAVERDWDGETLLTEASRKAGLPGDAWRRGARIELFETEVFGEDAY